MSHKQPAHWKVLSEQLYADCRIYRVFEQKCIHPHDERQGKFYVIRCNDWVQILPLTKEGEIILVNQYRFGTGQLSWEVPGGVMDDSDTSPEETAARELLEETGYLGKPGRIIGCNFPNPALQANKTHFVLIEGCEKVTEQSLDPNEELEVCTLPIQTAIAMAHDGRISHSIAINSIFYLENYLRQR